jgi:hypothetical protein
VGAFLATRARYGSSEAALLRRHPENRRWIGLNRPLVLALVALLARPGLLPLAGLELVGEVLAGAVHLRREVQLPARVGARALLRGHAVGFYHLARQSTRYYGIGLALVALRRKRLLGPLLAAVLGPAAADWVRLRPRLSPVSFAVAHVLDDLAYQLGCLRGCLRERTLAPFGIDLVVAGARKPRSSSRATTRSASSSTGPLTRARSWATAPAPSTAATRPSAGSEGSGGSTQGGGGRGA